MSLPYSFQDEAVAIHYEKLIVDGVNPTFQERLALAQTRGEQFGAFLVEELGRELGPVGMRGASEFQNLLQMLVGEKPDDGSLARLERPLTAAMLRSRDRFRSSLGLGAPKKAAKPGFLQSFITKLGRKFKKTDAEPSPEFVKLANVSAEYEYVNQNRCRRCGGFYKPVRQGSAAQNDFVYAPDGRLLSASMHDFWILTCLQCGAVRHLTISVPAQVEITNKLRGFGG